MDISGKESLVALPPLPPLAGGGFVRSRVWGPRRCTSATSTTVACPLSTRRSTRTARALAAPLPPIAALPPRIARPCSPCSRAARLRSRRTAAQRCVCSYPRCTHRSDGRRYATKAKALTWGDPQDDGVKCNVDCMRSLLEDEGILPVDSARSGTYPGGEAALLGTERGDSQGSAPLI